MVPKQERLGGLAAIIAVCFRNAEKDRVDRERSGFCSRGSGTCRCSLQLVVVRSSMDPEDTLQRFAGSVVFIGGGPPVWDAYARWFDARWLAGGGEVARNHRDQ
ncbi:hypothetical protein ACWTU8_15505 [Mesorhizobium sp. BHbdii]